MKLKKKRQSNNVRRYELFGEHSIKVVEKLQFINCPKRYKITENWIITITGLKIVWEHLSVSLWILTRDNLVHFIYNIEFPFQY